MATVFTYEPEQITVEAFGCVWRETTKADRYDIDRLHREEIVSRLGDVPSIVRISGCLAIFGTTSDAHDMIRC